MSYRLQCKESIGEGMRRIAREQVEQALAELDDPELDDHETVHQVRKRCKKIRGLLRLVRPRLQSSFQEENRFFRDAARGLSGMRDAQTMVDTAEKLSDAASAASLRDALRKHVRDPLIARRENLARDEDVLARSLQVFRHAMLESRARIDDWRLDARGFEAVRGGLAKTYRRGRKGLQAAEERTTSERLHEWRKRVKYHWYHCRLLQSLWKPPFKARRGEAHRLADLLGDDHDLAILRQTLREAPAEFGGRELCQQTVALIDQQRQALQTGAWPLGRRIFAESKKRLSQRFAVYDQAWREGA